MDEGVRGDDTGDRGAGPSALTIPAASSSRTGLRRTLICQRIRTPRATAVLIMRSKDSHNKDTLKSETWQGRRSTLPSLKLWTRGYVPHRCQAGEHQGGACVLDGAECSTLMFFHLTSMRDLASESLFSRYGLGFIGKVPDNWEKSSCSMSWEHLNKVSGKVWRVKIFSLHATPGSKQTSSTPLLPIEQLNESFLLVRSIADKDLIGMLHNFPQDD
ncbi:hypothetical protein G5I_10321 [Acromyrmex echinatior]|uniref:Uncharacterized protein n=1 Tax=Acromyrmex echinatior TaxID=103372 RepID=F4WWK7_ACREC|nr:hypothetical protein G5I_10321 [Acromyrmex echinatior]